MKKMFSLLLAVALFVTILPMNLVSANVTEGYPVYLVKHFENDKGSKTTDSLGNQFSLADGPGDAKKAIKVTDASNTPKFNISFLDGYNLSKPNATAYYQYNISAWIKADAAVNSDSVTFEINLPVTDTSSIHTYPTTVTESITVSGIGLTQEKWIKVTAPVYTYDGTTQGTYKQYGFTNKTANFNTAPEGTISVKVANGIAYTMDDLTVIPVDEKNIYESNNIAKGGIITSSTLAAPWSCEGATASISSSYKGNAVSYSYSTSLWKAEILGNVISVTDTSGGNASVVYSDSPIKIGNYYTIHFSAKSLNSAAQGAKFKVILDYSETDDTENIHFADKKLECSTVVYDSSTGKNLSTVTLSDTWTEYYARLDASNFSLYSYNSKGPKIRFELVREDGQSLSGASYLIGDLKIRRAAEFSLTPTGNLEAYPLNDTTYNVNVYSRVKTGEVKNVLTRVMVPFREDHIVLNAFDDAENDKSFQVTASDVSGMKMVLNAFDRDGFSGVEYVKQVELTKPHTLTAIAEFDQTVWAPDMKELSATIRYNASSGSETLKALCAMYDVNNKMVASDLSEFVLQQGEGKVSLTMRADTADAKTATTAKVFLWSSNSHAPIKEDVPVITKETNGKFIYVDPTGEYEYSNSVSTFNEAIEELKTTMATAPSDVYIILMPGYHRISSQAEINQTATKDGYNVVVTSYNKNNKGILSGGTDISGEFEPYENGIYRASVGAGTASRQLFVNGVKATKARSEELEADDFVNMWKTNGGGLTTTKYTELKDYAKIKDIEFVFYKLWAMHRCQVDSITGDANSISITMDSPAWGNINNLSNLYAEAPSYFENALELLDEEGEWYLSQDGYVYYMPREGEDISKAEVILPTYDNYTKGAMVEIIGTSSSPAKNVAFDNVEFAYTTWTMPNTTAGHVDHQNNHVRTQTASNGDLREGAVDVKYANGVDFTDCVFTKLGITGLRFLEGSKNCDVIGNEFYDISGSAINMGRPVGRNASSADRVENISVENNYIHNVATDYWSAAAISAGFPVNSNISHNEICYIPYSGMHIGYGWTLVKGQFEEGGLYNFIIENNYIHDLMQGDIYDGGAIYTNGPSGTTAGDISNTIKGNYIANIGPGSGGIYNDSGTTGWNITENVVDLSNTWGEYHKYTNRWNDPADWCNIGMHEPYSNNGGYYHYVQYTNNYSTANDRLIHHVSQADSTVIKDSAILLNDDGSWPQGALDIMANAGIEEEYRNNFEYGLQTMKVLENVTLSVGSSITNTPYFVTTKGEQYKNKDLVVSVTSSNENVATATKDKITAHSSGTATITYTVIENRLKTTVTTKVTVK